jgi:hypothetical protein
LLRECYRWRHGDHVTNINARVNDIPVPSHSKKSPSILVGLGTKERGSLPRGALH